MRVVIAGGGVAGLATALAMADDGHRVVVLERGGPVPQSRHAHTFTPLVVAVLRAHAPGLLAALLDAGASLVDMTRAMPPGPPDPADGELTSLACRRAMFDVVLRRYAGARPDVTIESGVTVVGLRSDGTQITGVRVDDGAVVPADLVVDATGRRALGRRWLADLGVDLPAEESVPVATTAYTRFYRRDGPMPTLNRGNAAGVLTDHYAGVLHPGDNHTFSVAIGTLHGDRELRRLRDPAVFDAVARVTPWIEPWLADATPITEVRAMACPANTLRALATTPVVAGMLPVGDAACVTDPMFGRGVGLALAHGFRLADLLRSCSPVELGPAAATATTELFTPWFRQACEESRDRIDRWRAAVSNEAAPTRPATALRMASVAAARDPEVWREVTRVLMGLRTPDRLTDPPFARRVRELVAAGPPAPPPGRPDRADLVAIVRGECSDHDHAGRGAR